MELKLQKMKIVTAGGQKKSKPEMIAFVLENAPEKYKMVTQSAKVSGKSLFKELQEIYKDFWKQEFKSKEGKNSKKKGGEAYSTKGGGKLKGKPWKKFKRDCRHCGKQGHKKAQCHEFLKKLNGGGGDNNNRA
jgi:hypothetical protein